jgi:competence protein ComEA
MKHLILVIAMVFTLFASVNINTASKEELMSLKGIGETKAEAIIKHRKSHGKFKTVQELTAVKGLGDKTVAKLAKELKVK